MPRLVDNQSRADVLIDAVNHVLAEDGAAGLTVRGIARVSGVSASSILHHFGSKERLVLVSAGRTALARRTRFLIAQAGASRLRAARGLLALLPGTDEDVVAARTWLAWLEIWRSDPALASVFDDHHDQVRAILAELTAHSLTAQQLACTLALADGLTIVVRSVPPVVAWERRCRAHCTPARTRRGRDPAGHRTRTSPQWVGRGDARLSETPLPRPVHVAG